MEKLPMEVIQDILLRLPINSILASKCVCPSWRNLVKDSRFTKLHFDRVSKENPIVVIGSYESELYAIPEDCEASDKSIQLRNLPFKSWLPKFRLMGSCNGLLCLADDTCHYRSMFICNPITGEYMKLPDIGLFGNVNGAFFGFGYEPEKQEYKVVRMRFIRYARESTIAIDIHTVGTDTWRRIGTRTRLIPGEIECWGVLACGNLHWLGCCRTYRVESILAVDLKDEEIHSIKPPPSFVGNNRSRVHLGSLGGCFSMVDDRFMNHVEVWVMKDYGKESSWTKEFVIERPVVLDEIARPMQTVGIRKDSKILMLCYDGTLLLYDPRTETCKYLPFRRLPLFYEPFLHVPSLISFKDVFGIGGSHQKNMEMDMEGKKD